MKPVRSRLALLGLPICLALAGCATEVNYTTTASDGQRLTFRLVNGVAVHPSEAGIRTDTPRLEPDPKNKNLFYLLRLFDENEAPPRSVKVEDVSDEAPVLLAEDLHPEIKNHQWRGVSRRFEFDEPASKWLSYVDQSFRVYRFTIVQADGRTVILHEGLMIPDFAKGIMRRMLGKDY